MPNVETMSALTKGDIYAMSAEMMETNAPIKQDHLVTFVRLLNKDIFLQDDNLRLLRILQVLLLKIKDGIYPKIPQLGETLVSLVRVGMKKVEGSSEPAQLALEILLETPGEMFSENDVDMNGPLVLLLENYLPQSPNACQQSVKEFLQKYLSCLSQSKKEEFGKVSLKFFLSDLIPFVFLDSNDNRSYGIDLIDAILPFVMKNSYFNDRHWVKIYENTMDPNKYPKTLAKLLSNCDMNWSRLWILLTKISGTELHRMGRSINPFLSVLQEGFKKNIECKYHAFLCLKALIENFALEKSILFNQSRVKVLSIALEINNAKTEKIALIKFKVWWYLISLMKSKISDFSSVVFLPFLKFCFGEFDKNFSIKRFNTVYPGESFESIQKLAIKSLTEMFGHFDCSGCTGSIFLKLHGPIVNSVLLDNYNNALVNSLKNSTKYAVAHMLKGDKTTFEELKLNVRCLWFSFIKLSNNTSLKKFSDIFKSILVLFAELVEENSQDALFAEVIMTLILPCIVMKGSGYSVTAFNDPSMKLPNGLIPIQYLLKSILTPKLYHYDTMSELHFDFKNLVEIGMIGEAQRFSTWLIKELVSNGHSMQIWCCLSNSYINNPEKISLELYRSIVIWPISEHTSKTKIVDVSAAWCKFYSIPISKLVSFKEKDMSQIDEEITTLLLKMCTKTNKSDPNLTPLFFLSFLIKKGFEESPGKMAAINRLTIGLEKYFSSLQSLKVSYTMFIGLSECLSNLSFVLSDCYSYYITTSSSKSITSVLNKSMKLIIQFFHQSYHESDNIKLDFHASIQIILNSLKKMIIPIYFSILREGLLNLLDVLMKTLKNPEIDNECSNLLKDIMDPDSKKIKLEKSDLIKIQMILNSKNKKPKDSVTNSAESSPFSFPNSKNGKKRTSTEDFVVIKSNWKFDPKNLTEHQKDVLKRRRDDIPALYEDLSQSQDENSMKTWRLSGGDSTNSQEQSSQGSNSNTIKLSLENSDEQIDKMLVNNEKQTNSPASIQNKSKSQSAPENFKDTCVRIVKTNILINDKKPDTPESNKLTVKITNKPDPKTDTPKSKKSIYSRLNENLLSLKSTNNQNETYVVNSNLDNETIPCTENVEKDVVLKTTKNTTPVIKKVIIIKKDSIKKISNELTDVLNTKSINTPIVDVSNDKPLRKRKASTDINEISDDVKIAEPVNKDKDISEEKTNETVQKPSTPLSRPLRVRRKPNKFLSDESADGKKVKNDKDNLATIDNTNLLNDEDDIKNNVCTLDHKSSSENSESSIFECFGTPKSSKKKSRLINQLVIDTKEGHPLMEINSIDANNSNVRKTRRSLGMTSIKVKSAKSPKTVTAVLKKEIVPKSKLRVETLVVNEETQNELDEEIENSHKKLDKSNKKSKQSHLTDENATENLNIAKSISSDDDNINSHNDNQVDLLLNNKIKIETNKDTKDKSECALENTPPEPSIIEVIENKTDENKDCNVGKDNVFDKIESELMSIFSQETEVIPVKIETSTEDKNDINDITFLNNRELLLSEDVSQNFDNCSPDCIESSQDETLSSISLKMLMSKPKVSEPVLEEKNTIPYIESHSTINEDKSNSSILTSQELAEADTEILTFDSVDDKSSEKIEKQAENINNLTADINLDNFNANENKDCVGVPINSLSDSKFENLDLSDAPSSPISTVNNISILSSPCKDDIEDRNREFLNNTMDISPIKDSKPEELPLENSISKVDLKISPTKDTSADTKAQPAVTSPDIFACEKIISKITSVDSTSPPKSIPTTTPTNKLKNLPSLSHISSRTVQMLNMCMFGDSNEAASKESYPDKKKDSISLIHAEKNIDSHSNTNTQSLFELTKMLPCLTASPAGPILKRKLEVDDLSMSPSSKKKRVSFHDPLVSTMVNVEKYICTKSNISPLNKEIIRVKRNRIMAPRSLTQKLETEAMVTLSTEPMKSDLSIDSAAETDSNSASISDICSLVVDLPKHLDVEQNDMFDDKVAIYPNLIDCEVSISEIASLLSSSLWKEEFIKEINNKIVTIGDLAKLTEADINRLPIKHPKVETAKQAMITYEAKINRDLLINDVSTLESLNDDKIDINKVVEKSFSDDLPCLNNDSQTDENILNKDSQNVKEIDDSSIINNIDIDCLVEKDVSMDTEDNTLSVVLPSNQEVINPEPEHVLNSLITDEPDKTLKTIVDKVNHNTILDNIPFSSVLSYLKSKMDNDEDKEKILETLSCDNSFKKQNLDNSLKLFRNKLSTDFEKILSSINEFVDT